MPEVRKLCCTTDSVDPEKSDEVESNLLVERNQLDHATLLGVLDPLKVDVDNAGVSDSAVQAVYSEELWVWGLDLDPLTLASRNEVGERANYEVEVRISKDRGWGVDTSRVLDSCGVSIRNDVGRLYVGG